MKRRIFIYFIGLLMCAVMYLVVRAVITPKVLGVSRAASIMVPVSAGLDLPSTSAKSIFILDMTSQTVLYQLDADTRVYPASTTKMMTALVAINLYPLTKTITIDKTFPLGVYAGFKIGEQVTVEQLLYTMLVESANDAAEILAENAPGGREAFVQSMNDTAKSLRLKNTHFVNPTGLDEPDHYSSAADLARLAQVVLQHPLLAKIVSTENVVISTNNSPHIVSNVNQLLGRVPGVLGVKTGFTDLAGQTLITYVVRDNHPVIIALLGSQDRFGDTEALIDWVYKNFSWSRR